MNSHSSKAGLFLMELIIAILVFSIAGAVCVQLFAKSYMLSIHSRELSNAVSLAQSQAEIFYGNPGDITDADVFYNKDFELCSRDAASYEMTAEEDKGDISGIRKYSISINRISGEEIYSLCVERTTQD